MNRVSKGFILLFFLSSSATTFCCVTIYGMGQGDDQNSVELCVTEDTTNPTFGLYAVEENQGPIPVVVDEEEHHE